MAGIKEIRTRIDSVQQTLKITNAMYLISSSKLRKARQQLNNVQPYFLKISSTIADILHHSAEIEHIYFDKRPDVKRRKAATSSSRATRDWPVRTIITCCVWPRSILRRRTIQRYFSSVRWAARTSPNAISAWTASSCSPCRIRRSPCTGHCRYFHPSVPRRTAGRRVRCLHRNDNAYAA